MATRPAQVSAPIPPKPPKSATYSDSFKGRMVQQCIAPGVSVAAIALAHGINADLVRRWIVRQQRRTNVPRVMPGPVMLPVTRIPLILARASATFINVAVPGRVCVLRDVELEESRIDVVQRYAVFGPAKAPKELTTQQRRSTKCSNATEFAKCLGAQVAELIDPRAEFTGSAPGEVIGRCDTG